MTMKPIDLEQLDEASFIGEQSGSNLKIKSKISNEQGNSLELRETGLYVPEPNANFRATTTFPCTWSNAISGSGDGTLRRNLTVNNATGMGIIHLDFKRLDTHRGVQIATLPANAPTPVELIEILVPHSTGSFALYITARSRTINASGTIPVNQRFIANLVGFFA